MHNLGDILYEEGRYAEAETMLRETLNISRRVLGPEHPDTAASIYSLGSIALLTGKRDEALADLLEAVNHGLPPNMDLGIETDPDLRSLHGTRDLTHWLPTPKSAPQQGKNQTRSRLCGSSQSKLTAKRAICP